MPLNLVNYSDSSSDNDDKEEEEEEYDKPKQQQQTKEQSGTKRYIGLRYETLVNEVALIVFCICSKLPNPFEKPTQVEQNERDNASEHEGRVRLFPHERGNWATYVYIHCKNIAPFQMDAEYLSFVMQMLKHVALLIFQVKRLNQSQPYKMSS